MKTLITFCLWTFTIISFAQTDTKKAELIDQTEVNADVFIGYDKFDFLYFIKDNVIHKQKKDVSLEYKNLALGKITKVDLLNPLKVIVFYERFNTIITLDNQLNETLKINFSELKIPLMVSNMGIASQNRLWVFDQITQQIYLYDTLNGTLKSLGTPISEEIVFYNSDFNYFEWLDDKKQWYQCSLFGTIENLNYQFDFDIILFANSELIFYKKDATVFIFNRKTNEVFSIENIEKSFENLTYKNQILSIFTNRGISNYKITIP